MIEQEEIETLEGSPIKGIFLGLCFSIPLWISLIGWIKIFISI
ncbi:hypothetical protein ACTNDN_20820 [Niallia sp. HCP3S3_B10]